MLLHVGIVGGKLLVDSMKLKARVVQIIPLVGVVAVGLVGVLKVGEVGQAGGLGISSPIKVSVRDVNTLPGCSSCAKLSPLYRGFWQAPYRF